MLLDNSRLNPFPWYRTMRETEPVSQHSNGRGWSVFRYADVQRVLSDYTVFSSHFGGSDENANARDPLGVSLISLDPPRHRQLRSLVTQAFTPRAIAALAPRIEEITSRLLDDALARGRLDVIDDLAYPLPVTVIAELLGIPAEDRLRFKRWSDAIVSNTGGPESGSLYAEMIDYFRATVARKRRDPGDDLISGLLKSEVDGERLSEIDLLGFCALLLVAGNETTTNLIGNAILCFDEFPESVAPLRVDPDLLPQAIEEVLRYRSPVQMMFRTARAAVEIDGQTIRAGQSVLAWIGSANRDERQFPEPDRFDIERRPNRHIAFGHGIHFCLGAPLARLEARIALGALFSRIKEFSVDPHVTLEPIDSSIVFGVKRLPISFEMA